MELRLDNVTKRYGEKVALDGFSYTFHTGIYGILGANGAGKSTMMNLITDNLKRDGGEITFDGAEIRKLGAAYRRILGYMTQQQGLYEGMTAESFLVYMARLKEIPRKAVPGEIDRVLEMTNLADVRHKKVGSFSGGMKQRAALIRTRIAELRAAERAETDPDAARRLRLRIETLRPLLRETRELAVLTARYYDRSYHKHEKYTL